MRRIRKVTIAVSENFYNLLNQERERVSKEYSKHIGFRKDVSLFAVTENLAAKMASGGLGFNNGKQKRRRI